MFTGSCRAPAPILAPLSTRRDVCGSTAVRSRVERDARVDENGSLNVSYRDFVLGVRLCSSNGVSNTIHVGVAHGRLGEVHLMVY